MIWFYWVVWAVYGVGGTVNVLTGGGRNGLPWPVDLALSVLLLVGVPCAALLARRDARRSDAR